MTESTRETECQELLDSLNENDDINESVNKKEADNTGENNELTKNTDLRSKYKSESDLHTPEEEEDNSLERKTYSEDDLSITDPLKSISILKAKLEDKIRSTSGKICKECFFNSIESHLCSLGIITPCGNNFDVLEEVEDNGENHEKVELIEKERSESSANESKESEYEGGLLNRLHRRTVSTN